MFDHIGSFTAPARRAFDWLTMPANPTHRTAERMVHEGADALDRYLGSHDWVMRVDADILHMSGVRLCVLGQLFGDYCDAPDHLISMESFGVHTYSTANGNLAAAWVNWLEAEQRAYRRREIDAILREGSPADHIAERRDPTYAGGLNIGRFTPDRGWPES